MGDTILRAVSYTHLDVYKRQAPGKVSGRNEDFFFLQLAGDLIRTVAVNRHGKEDVYKRQNVFSFSVDL